MLSPVPLQRLEGLVFLAAGVAAFAESGWSWWWFAALLLVPDISMIGYLIRPSAGAISYNVGHTFVGPALLLVWAWIGGPPAALALGAIWLAHIGMDRAFGYGLKFADNFTNTHLGEIGRLRGR
jgi:hypothetical protein